MPSFHKQSFATAMAAISALILTPVQAADYPPDDPRVAGIAESAALVNLAQWQPVLDPAGLALLSYLTTRQVNLDFIAGAEIPFVYPERPTIDCWFGGRSRPLLFNTGTNTSILWQNAQWPELPPLHPTAFSPLFALLEGKSRLSDDGQRLDYARAVLLQVGGASLYNVPFRIYSGGSDPGGDFAGALAPIAFRQYVIEIDNSDCAIRLHQRREWLPPPGTQALPLLSLPRGIFLPLWLGDEGGAAELFWFHLDTGFSGTIGIVPEVCQAHPDWFAPLAAPSQEFLGWHAQYTYTPQLIRRLEFHPLPVLGCPGTEPQIFTDVEGLAYRDAYSELAGYRIGGILGSGFLRRFSYALDYELARFYILPD